MIVKRFEGPREVVKRLFEGATSDRERGET